MEVQKLLPDVVIFGMATTLVRCCTSPGEMKVIWRESPPLTMDMKLPEGAKLSNLSALSGVEGSFAFSLIKVIEECCVSGAKLSWDTQVNSLSFIFS